eukprot:PhM_4_TR10294/c0_g1_i1/m.77347
MDHHDLVPWSDIMSLRRAPPSDFLCLDHVRLCGDDPDWTKGRSVSESVTFYPDGTYARYGRLNDVFDVTEFYHVGVYFVEEEGDNPVVKVVFGVVCPMAYGCPSWRVERQERTYPLSAIGKVPRRLLPPQFVEDPLLVNNSNNDINININSDGDDSNATITTHEFATTTLVYDIEDGCGLFGPYRYTTTVATGSAAKVFDKASTP